VPSYYSQQIALPLKGMDEHDGLSLPPDIATDLRNVRMIEGKISSGPGCSVTLNAPATPALPRNLVQAFFIGSTSDIVEQLLLFTYTKVYKRDSLGWSNLGESYGPNHAYVPPNYGGERFALVNYLNRLAWTILDYTPRVKVRLYDGASITSISPDYSSRFMLGCNNRLVLAFTNEAGVLHRSRLRWCVNGDFTDWAGIGSGFLDLDAPRSGTIIGTMQLGPRQWVCSERDIIELQATGSLSPVFQAGEPITGTIMWAPWTWAATEYFGFFVGTNDVYRWDGTTFTPLGLPVRKTLTAAVNDLGGFQPDFQGAILDEDSEYWLNLGDGNVWVYDYRSNRWYHDAYPAFISTLARVRSAVATRAFGTSSYTQDIQAGHNELMNLVDSDAVTYLMYPTTAGHLAPAGFNANRIDRFVTTTDYQALDFVNGQPIPTNRFKNKLQAVRIRSGASAVVEVGASVDGGANWTTQTITCNGDGLGVAWFSLSHDKVRFRFRNNPAAPSPLSVIGSPNYEWSPAGVNL
jgi:hypothetical protein